MPKFLARSLLLKLLLLLLIFIVGLAAARMVKQALLLRQEAGEARLRIEELSRRKSELERALAELDTEEVLEREAKARLNLKRPGEKVAVVVPEEEKAPPAPAATLWDKLKAFFRR